MSDEALVGELWTLVDAVEDDDVADELAFALDELLERFAADAAKRARWNDVAAIPDRREWTREMDAWLAGVEARAALRPLPQQLGA